MNREEAFESARRLVQEGVDVANQAGIATAAVISPHCPEIDAQDEKANQDSSESLNWCGLPVRIDNAIEGLFEMPEPKDDPEQQPVFLVTQATADLVRQDFERYQPSLERMVEDWQEEKSHFMRELAHRKKDEKKAAKRSDIKRRK